MGGLLSGVVQGWSRKAADVSGLTWQKLWGEDHRAKAGVNVHLDNALGVTTVLSAVRVIAEGNAQVPCRVYRDGDGGSKTPATDHPAYKLLARRPNDWMTAFEFIEGLTMHAVLTGDGLAYINWVRNKPLELLPLLPGSVTVLRQPDYEVSYRITDSSGQQTVVPKKNILHLRGPSWDSLHGINMIHAAREAIGLAIATEEVHGRLFSNGAQPGGVLSTGNLSVEAAKRLKADWKESQAELHNKFKTAVLPGDAKWTPMAMKGVDNQHLETRKFQIEEICRALRLFPQMVGHTDKTATFASAEAFFLAHVIHCLDPWTKRWQQVLERDLLDNEADLSVKFMLQGLLRGDAKTRAEFYASGIQNGWLTRNEARLLEDLNPLPGLDEPLVPLNMATQGQVDAMAQDVVKTVKSMLRHNGGPMLDDAEIEHKIGRVLSKTNETRIRKAKDKLDRVLASLPEPVEDPENAS